jgi:hypothetical protein
MWAEDANDRRPATTRYQEGRRHQNDSLVATARELGIPNDAPFVFLCECCEDFCSDYVKLTIAEYVSGRRERAPVLCPGHLAARPENQAA